MSEEEKMQQQTDYAEDVVVYKSVPYFLFDDDLSIFAKQSYETEMAAINKYYKQYKKGTEFVTEGTNAEYVPSDLKFKKAANILNKEARFMFANPVTYNLNINDVSGEFKDQNAILQNFLEKVLQKNNMDGKLIKAAKDCLIGKRVGVVVNFNDNGISITFLKSTEFIFESTAKGVEDLTKFISFYNMNDAVSRSDQRWFKKTYTLENGIAYVEDKIYDGLGVEVEVVTEKTATKFNRIPAAVILNDGLTGDTKGVSELENLSDYEKYYSKLANADMDIERKTMNPVAYTIDASQESTKGLSRAPGSFWDIQSDDDKAEPRQAQVGTIENSMQYSGALKTTLDRIENQMYAEVDAPNINSEKLQGVITSGKALQALYWDLTVRCDEKMLAWSYALRYICDCIIEGAKLYPNSISRYTNVSVLPDLIYDLTITNNYPLPEDVAEEKEIDLAEINASVMSRKAYLKKWRNLNDKEADEEIAQIKKEMDLFENSELTDLVKETNEGFAEDDFE